MDNNIFCPICGYNFIDKSPLNHCPNCKVDLNGTLYKTYEGKYILKGLIPFKMYEKS